MRTTPNPAAIHTLDLDHVRIDHVAGQPSGISGAPKCDVQLTISHEGEDDAVTVWISMPYEWNGRFLGLGGSGFLGGWPGALAEPVNQGFAAASTDGGHTGSSADFALNADRTLNWPGITNFGHRAVHDMAVAAKAVIELFYGVAPRHSYFVGCSTGGRQGIMAAQRYPNDFDGVLAGCPVINFDRLQFAQFWGQVVMQVERNPISAAKFEAVQAWLIAQFDEVGDGIADGMIGDTLAVEPEFADLVGLVTPDGPITQTDADLVRRIVEGPRRADGSHLWYGVAPGASFTDLQATAVVDGELVGQPFIFDIWWVRYLLTRDPEWDWRTMTLDDFERFFGQSVEEFADVIASDDPDLRPFIDRGGKLLLWHGLVDGGVPFQGSVEYVERVIERVGADAAADSVRLFLAPGVGHCSGGPGPQPVGTLDTLIEWVESGTAPDAIRAERADDGGASVTRPIFAYPSVARWDGVGDPREASSYEPAEGTRLTPPERRAQGVRPS